MSAAGDFSAIDRHALAAPRAAAGSIPSLAAYLTGPARTPREAARALFRWVTENIAYDTGAPLRRHAVAGGDAAAAALAGRHAVCGGIAGLFQALAGAAGLEAATVTGHSKGQGYTVEKAIRGRPDHAWNAVRLDGAWHLLDATWGGGAFMGRGYRRRFDDHYFLTPPEAFNYDHFPEDAAWQLLPRPLTLKRFEALPHLKSAFFRCGLELGSHRQARIVTSGTARITLSAPPAVAVHAELRAGGRSLSPTTVLVQREDGELAVRVAPPRAGPYLLRVYVRPAGEQGAYAWALDYRLRAARGADLRGAFPRVHGAFVASGARLHEPLAGHLAAGRRQRFRIAIPGAEEAVVAGGRLWQPLEKGANGFAGAVTLPKGAVRLAGRFPGEEEFQVLLAYTAA